MTVADLNFSLGVSGEKSVRKSLETIEDGLEDAQDAAERLDDADPDVDVDADVGAAKQKIQAALNTVRVLDDKDANIDVRADGVQETIAEGVAAAQRLDQLDADIDLGIDRDGLRRAASSLPSGGGSSRGGIAGGRRLPGELDEVGEAFSFISALPGQLKAVGAAATAAAAALGAGAGLAGVATALAKEMGPRGLQQDVKAAQSSLKTAGRDFAEAFSGVIRSEVLPAIRGLSGAVRAASDDLATFSGFMLDFLKNIPGAGIAVGAVVGAGRRAGGKSNSDAIAQGIGDVAGTREIFTTLNKQIGRVRERFRLDLIPKEEMLSQIVDFRKEAFKNLQKLSQAVPGAFPSELIRTFASDLKKVEKQLKRVQGVSLQGVAVQPADASKADPAGQASLETGKGIGARIPDQISGIPNAQKKINLLNQKINQTSRAGKRAASILQSGFLRVGDAIGSSLVNSIAQGKSAIQGLRSVFSSVIQSLISQLAGLAVKLGVIVPLLGAIGLGTGGAGLALPAVSGQVGAGIVPFAEGGVVTGTTLGIIGEGRESEAVMPLSKLGSMLDAAAVAGSPPAAASGGMSIRQGGDASTQVTGTTLNVEIPVEAVQTAGNAGKRNLSRTGRS